MKTIKLSYSILSAWQQGKWEDAVAMYRGKDLPSTPYMELGKTKHKQWEAYTNKTGELHPELGGGKLKNPITERKYSKVIPFSDEYQILFRGVLDLEYDDVLVDYKCGRTMPSNYIDGWQLDAYKLLRPNGRIGKYLCFNPYSETLAVGVKYLNDGNAEFALENIITYGGELIDYLVANRLIIDFKEA